MPKQLQGTHPGKSGVHAIVATDEDLQLIHDLAASGRSRKVIACRLGISNTLLDKWMDRDKTVRGAWERGMAAHEDFLGTIFDSILENPKHKMQATTAMFLAKVKHGWSEKQTVEVQTTEAPKATGQFTVTDISPADDAS